MAAAAGTALLRSAATKIGMAAAPRAPSLLLHHPPLVAGLRGRRPGPASSHRHSYSSSTPSGSTPPPTNNKDLTQNRNVPSELHSAKAASRKLPAYLAYFMLYGIGAFLYFDVKPRFEELNKEIDALRTEKSILVEALKEWQTQDVLADSSKSQSMQASGRVKETDGQGS